jgi:hypothetical protein
MLTLLDGERVELLSTRAFAPGSRPEATLEGSSRGVWMKVHGSHREPDGRYRVAGRLLNATRELRTTLEQSMKDPES